MMWGYYYNNPGMAVWGVIVSLFWLSLAAVAVWALVRWLSRHARPTPPAQMQSQQSPLDILRARYARGEIDTATYHAMREELEYPSAVPAQSHKVPLPVER